MTYYVGILDGRGDVWGVRVPDVPGCFGGGATPDAAIADAISALRVMAEDGALAKPRAPDEIASAHDAEFDAAAGESMVMLPLLADLGRAVRANISLDAGILGMIDAEAARRGLTRSSFLVSAAVDKIIGGDAGHRKAS